MALDTRDLTALFAAIVDIESVSGNESDLADQVEDTLRAATHLEMRRWGNTLAARTNLGRRSRVVIAGHLDTVPVASNLPSQQHSTTRGRVLVGRGTADMKGGVAVMLKLATELSDPTRDVTWIFYDNEEVAADLNGLGLLAAAEPGWLTGDLGILMEPTSARIEGGCQGTMRFTLTTKGVASHSARPWLGHNAIHDMAGVLSRVAEFGIHEIEVDGLTYKEALNATMISGGIASNVIPDRCTVEVNYRFAPDKSSEQAEATMREEFADLDFTVLDLSPAARPGLDRPAAREFVDIVGGVPSPKYGWTDVARFSLLGIPALNFGPGDPGKAHTDDEFCPLSDLTTCESALRRWLGQG